jgi:endonuclease-3 related protein
MTQATTAQDVVGQPLDNIFQRLLAHYGPQGWWPGDDRPFVVVVGAILTQAAAWKNVEKALHNLERAGALTPEGLLRLPEEELARLVYPAGYYNAKARKLKAFAEMLHRRCRSRLESLFALPLGELRRALLETYGIGPETADDIILYAAGRPVFVVDAYTRRIFSRLGLRPGEDTYGAWQSFFMHWLPPDVSLFKEYHALLVRHGKETCRREPRCADCCLLDVCATGREVVGRPALTPPEG